jgi:hypothetical protein
MLKKLKHCLACKHSSSAELISLTTCQALIMTVNHAKSLSPIGMMYEEIMRVAKLFVKRRDG